ncbi:MAG: tRNA (guanosine(37)-N1)-methyltransferase TrmD [Planctomycetota bacterium]|nr:MAG: tRNA (guanosine(37)-N1)-methyltransferase TrmD [Planctomycetota bacterium]
MRFDVLTLFPQIFGGYLTQSLLAKAIERHLVDVQLHDIRDWAKGKHKKVDDRPFGGGPGMVMMVEPVVECVEAVQAMAQPPGRLIQLTPQGRRLDQSVVEELCREARLILLCGRYEGFDERVSEILKPDAISIGDYVLNGGEVAAMVVIDAVIRHVPGVLGDEESAKQDSFSGDERQLEWAQYTRPREFRGHAVPEVLIGGNHEQIAAWRAEQGRKRTEKRKGEMKNDEL